MDWLQVDIGTLHVAYASGEITPSQVVALFLDRVQETDYAPVWISQFDAVTLQARAATLESEAGAAGLSALPLYGVLVAVKDNIDVGGLPTTAACPAFSYEPERSAAAVVLLERAGAIIVGKTNLDQFATGLVGVRSPYGEVPNACDRRYVSGGSSSGSAVAVALGQVHLALGTDTAGSGRVPAALNNLVGLKPSYGLISAAGLVPACRSLDCISILARTVADAARALAVMTTHNDDLLARKPEWVDRLDLTRLRIAIPGADYLTFLGDDLARQAFEDALALLTSLGAVIEEIDFGPFVEAASLLYDGPYVAERLEAANGLLRDHPESLDPVVAAVIAKGNACTAFDAFSAQHRIAALRKRASALMNGYAALVVPTIPTIYTRADVRADPIKLNSNLGTYTNGVNLLDMCALAVPTHYRADDMPAGITLIAAALHDMRLAQLGQRIGQALRLPLGATGQPYPVVDAPLKFAPGGARVRVAVVGAHLSGMPLNGQLTERGATLVASTHTAPAYRLYHLKDTTPPKPGLMRTAHGGAAIAVEVWEMPLAQFGSFVTLIPSPLGIGTVMLEDGSAVHSFICEAYGVDGARDITEFGGWKNYIASLSA